MKLKWVPRSGDARGKAPSDTSENGYPSRQCSRERRLCAGCARRTPRRVVVTGHRDDASLVLIFPYAAGAFRDTFTWHRDQASWTLLIEAQSADKSWATFATYSIVHPPR